MVWCQGGSPRGAGSLRTERCSVAGALGLEERDRHTRPSFELAEVQAAHNRAAGMPTVLRVCGPAGSASRRQPPDGVRTTHRAARHQTTLHKPTRRAAQSPSSVDWPMAFGRSTLTHRNEVRLSLCGIVVYGGPGQRVRGAQVSAEPCYTRLLGAAQVARPSAVRSFDVVRCRCAMRQGSCALPKP